MKELILETKKLEGRDTKSLCGTSGAEAFCSNAESCGASVTFCGC